MGEGGAEGLSTIGLVDPETTLTHSRNNNHKGQGYEEDCKSPPSPVMGTYGGGEGIYPKVCYLHLLFQMV